MKLLRHIRDRLLAHEVPQVWDALRQDQFAAIVRAQKGADEVWVRTHIVWALLGIGWRTPLRLAAFRVALTRTERWQLLKLADPFLERTSMRTTLVQALRGRRTLHPCVPDLLNDLDVETWGHADGCFMRWAKSGNADHLRALVAYLYVPKDVLGRLMPREQRLRGGSVHLVNALHEHQLELVARQWSMHRMVLERECPEVFAGGEKRAAAARWEDVLLRLSGEVLGDYQKTSRAPARLVLRKLNNDLKEWKEMKRKAEQRKRA